MKLESRTLDAANAECPPTLATPDAVETQDRAAHSILARLTGGFSPISAWLACGDWWSHLLVSPGKCAALAWRGWEDGLANMGVGPGATDVGSEGAGDPRFKQPGWNHWPYAAWRDAFLRSQAWWREATTGVRGVDAHHRDLASFYARQWLDCFAPSNFPMTHPQVLSRTIETGGENFVVGLRNWQKDYVAMAQTMATAGQQRRARGVPAGGPAAPVHADGALRVGHELAITPGEVVWRNELAELIQYSPSAPVVAREPLLIVPSWILKYYILDLQPHDSLVRHLVDQGYTVFMMSWKNPDSSYRDVDLNDYMRHALLPALDEVRRRCEGEPVHALGYCLGGTLLSIAAATLARDGKADAIATVTLLAAQTDFTDPGELGLFIDASELAALDALMWEQGYLDGAQMAVAFQMLNSRDLIWSRMMSEYLLGVRSKPNDLMTWNADTTRLPYRMHRQYLDSLFLRDDLAEGRYCVDGHPVVLSDIHQPLFVVGTERDHVSPWRSVYKLHLNTHDELTFVLTSRGHNAGIVSPPGTPERQYRVATRRHDDPYRSPDVFLRDVAPVDGSWWTCLTQWLSAHSSGTVDARTPTDSLCAAPGTYVLES